MDPMTLDGWDVIDQSLEPGDELACAYVGMAQSHRGASRDRRPAVRGMSEVRGHERGSPASHRADRA